MGGKSLAKNKHPHQPPAGNSLIQQHYCGPIPPPDLLHHYNQIIPGAAERILQMAEAEATHRHEIERGVLAAQQEAESNRYRETSMGQRYAIMAVALDFSIVAYSLYLHMEKTAMTIATSTIVGLAMAFVAGRKKPS